MLTDTQLRVAIEKVLREVQTISGRDCPRLADATKPIGDLDAFDSLTAVEATVLLELELNCKIAQGTPFISASGKRALTVAEAVERLAKLISAERAA
jgi:acyl carrier protein